MKNEIQNNKLVILGKLAASLAHEIRNPLSALKLNLNFLEMSKDEIDPEMRECISASVEATERIQELIDNTLEFSRLPVRKMELCSINDLVEQAIDMSESSARRKTIEIKATLDETIPRLILNENKIIQILLNLITNAIEASQKDNHIWIKTKLDEDYAFVEVKDEGSGIKEENQDKVFTDFFTNKKQGTGLGLSVCKMLLEELNGDIYFESKEGKGTTFYIKLPWKELKVHDEAKVVNS